ncbi:MAG: riboflavin synthase [Alphaproteobacteria bacterium]|nr:riboflavin synthase [Alphaproteobacteria bacterium]
MFSGIISEIGKVVKLEEHQNEARFTIETTWDLAEFPMGCSIACSGTCLTLVDKTKHTFAVDVSRETLAKTNLGNWKEGTRINLEKSLRLGDEISGHFVFGHVDGLAKIGSIEPSGGSRVITLEIPQALKKFIAPKGSVSLDGISLTVNEVNDCQFKINIIPHTWDATTFADRKVGDTMNFEADMLARYVVRAQEAA